MQRFPHEDEDNDETFTIMKFVELHSITLTGLLKENSCHHIEMNRHYNLIKTISSDH